MAQTTLRTAISEPLTGEDAERLVAYIENPVMPKGHDEFLKQSEQVFADIPARGATDHS